MFAVVRVLLARSSASLCAVVRESLRGRPRLLFARSSASLCAVIRDNSRCAAVRDTRARSSAILHPCPCAAIRDYCQCAVVRDILARPSAILHMCPRAVIRDYSLGARLLRGHPRFCSVSQQTRPSIFMSSFFAQASFQKYSASHVRE